MKKTYKPKAKNEVALKKYKENAVKKSNTGHNRNRNNKR